MQRLLDILLLFKEYIVLVILIVISLLVLGANDNAQLRAIRSYTIGAVGLTQDVLSVVPNIFELKNDNQVLQQLDINLSNEVNLLREARLENIRLRSMLTLKEHSPLTLVTADVVGKSLLLLRNTITLNVGERDGVKPDMPVLSASGLVGKILATSDHYAIGQLMLNKDFRASAKIQRSRVDGIIVWDGGDYLKLRNVAKTQDVQEGDVVITSEYSNIFPDNTKIGIVAQISQKAGSLFQEIDVKPSADFSSLEQVFVVTSVHAAERDTLEKKINSKR